MLFLKNKSFFRDLKGKLTVFLNVFSRFLSLTIPPWKHPGILYRSTLRLFFKEDKNGCLCVAIMFKKGDQSRYPTRIFASLFSLSLEMFHCFLHQLNFCIPEGISVCLHNRILKNDSYICDCFF